MKEQGSFELMERKLDSNSFFINMLPYSSDYLKEDPNLFYTA
jgi:hypothetical protein